jgi:hypothetical protein
LGNSHTGFTIPYCTTGEDCSGLIPVYRFFVDLINEKQAVVVRALAGSSDDFDGKAGFFNRRKDIDTTGLHRWTGTVSVATLLFLYRTLLAKITRPSAEAEGLPAAEKKNLPLKLSDYRFYIGIRLAMEQYRPAISIQDVARLLRCRRKRRANQALPVSIASELTLQPNPSGSFHLRWRDYTGVYDSRLALHKLTQFLVG